MKKLFSARYSAGAVNAATFLLRIAFGLLLMHHGYDKLSNFDETAGHMAGFLGMSGKVAASLVIFAEFFCSILVVLGLATRLATIPIIITMAIALFKAHNLHVTSDGEMATLYLSAFLVLLIIGPGKVSVDAMIGK